MTCPPGSNAAVTALANTAARALKTLSGQAGARAAAAVRRRASAFAKK